jgi:hypothetical protein
MRIKDRKELRSMAKRMTEQFVDVGRAESEEYEPSEEVRSEFDEAAQLGLSEQWIKRLQEHHPASIELSGGDIDASWEDADVGEEAVGGENPTPDQDIVEGLGRAVGLIYEDGEPLHTTEKMEGRDEHRWELDPASSEGFDQRMKHEGEYEEK